MCKFSQSIEAMAPYHYETLSSLSADQLVEILRRDPEFLQSVDCFGSTPLFAACALGRADLVSTLLDRGADPNFIGSDGMTALKTLIENDERRLNREIADLLFRAGADGNISFDPVLHVAVGRGHAVDDIEYLVARGCDPNGRDGDEVHPLYMATLEADSTGCLPTHRLEQIRALLRLGADPDMVGCCCGSLDDRLAASDWESLSAEVAAARSRRERG